MSEESPGPAGGAGGHGSGAPGGGEQESGAPETGQPGAGQQESGAPETGRPGGGQRESGAPEADRVDAGQPESGAAEAGQPDAGRHDWDVPWIEAIGAGQPERAQLAARFGEGFRKTNSLAQLMGQAAADRIGLNATDLNCLNILSFSGEMTAGDLARETGLTTASITGVADRLEQAGYVRRERDPKDRRRVVIRLVLDNALRDVAPVFLPLVQAWQGVVDRYTDDELRLIVDFYDLMEQVIRDHLVRLRGPAQSGAPGEPGTPVEP
jgi:DNA-binding transcriptional ArsR family regulator